MSHSLRFAATPAALLFATAALIHTASAQDINTYYTVQHPDEFTSDWKAFYLNAEQLTIKAREALPHQLDIAYGAHPKQHLDVYMPAGKPQSAPVFVFLHGGGMREGDRVQYGYVATPFAKHGIVTVVASYRLQPEFPWPAQQEDAQVMMTWVYRNIASFGGDPERIFLGGHSAGSRLTAYLSLGPDWREAAHLPVDVIKGAALISGVSADTVEQIANPPPVTVVSVGSLETEGGADGKRLVHTQALSDRIRATGHEVDFSIPEGHDHATLVASLCEEGSVVFTAILRMIQETP